MSNESSLSLRDRLRTGMRRCSRRFPRLSSAIGLAKRRHRPIRAILRIVLHLVGLVMSIDAVMSTRTPQGAIAWAFSLNTVPLVAVPAYAVFGDRGFDDYVETSSERLDDFRPVAREHLVNIAPTDVAEKWLNPLMTTASHISQLPVTSGNRFELLVDGEKTYHSIFREIESAESYVLVQFYIIRDDKLGGEFKQVLIAKAKEGVHVHLLYDDYGCIGLGEKYFDDLREAGVRVSSFMQLGGGANRFQLNFRNHRKLVVVDGRTAIMGGHNIGTEYLGLHPDLTPWRDSSVRVTGPSVACLQVPFVEDWMWATGEKLDDLQWNLGSEWRADPDGEGGFAVPVAAGPADGGESGSLYFQALINGAQERIWIATPYFVPDEAVMGALRLAALRGVKVRLLLPDMADNALVKRASYSFVHELDLEGIRIFRYSDGFLHQKVVLVDDDIAAVGSSNLDNRSLRLNFELMLTVQDKTFATEVKEMLEQDFDKSREVDGRELESQSAWFRFTVHVARLLAPIQ